MQKWQKVASAFLPGSETRYALLKVVLAVGSDIRGVEEAVAGIELREDGPVEQAAN